MKALTEYRHQLLETGVKIFVRRGGPNYQEGLRVMREVGECVTPITTPITTPTTTSTTTPNRLGMIKAHLSG